MSNPEFHDLLRLHRISRNLSLADLANLAGVSRSHLSNLELGRRLPSGIHAKAIGDALALDAEATRTWLAAAAESHIPTDLRDFRV